MEDKFDEYNDVLTRLVKETVACTPQEWTRGRLSIECDGMRINYQLKNENEPGIAQISDRLRDLIDEFYIRMANRGETWIEACINFHQEGDSLKFNTEFKYAQVASQPAPEEKKPWWKIW